MSLLLRLLEKKYNLRPQENWTDIDDNTFNQLAEDALSLYQQYRAQCAALITYIQHQSETSDLDSACLQEAINETLMVTTLMETLFDRMNERHAKFKLTEDKRFLEEQLHHVNPTTFPAAVQYLTEESDTLRLYLGHTQRIAVALLVYLNYYHTCNYIVFLSQCIASMLAYASLLIYLPRTLVNLTVTFQNLTQTNRINLSSRWHAHLGIDDRLFLIINDMLSLTAACIGFFVLTGTAPVLALPVLTLTICLTVIVKLTEMLLDVGKAWVELERLHAIQDEYNALPIFHDKHQKLKISAFETQQMKSLSAYLRHEKEKLQVGMIIHTLLLPCLIAFIPLTMLAQSCLPIIAAVFAIVLLSIRLPSFRSIFLEEPPEANLQALHSHRFFTPKYPSLITPAASSEDALLKHDQSL